MRISPSSAFMPLVAFVVVLSLLVIQSAASAGMLASTPYAYDDDLGPGVGGVWQGSVAYNRTTLGNTIQGTLEYAVFFGPGAFQNFLNDSLGGPPPFNPAPGEVIYAYQLLDVTATPGASTISVGLDPIDIPGTVSPPSWIPTGAVGEVLPNLGEYAAPTSMVWRFQDNAATPGVDERINTGEQSPILIFSSEYLPELDKLTINSGVAGTPSYVDAVPSIGVNLGIGVPEPSSLAILLIGSSLALGLSRRRS